MREFASTLECSEPNDETINATAVSENGYRTPKLLEHLGGHEELAAMLAICNGVNA